MTDASHSRGACHGRARAEPPIPRQEGA